MFTSSIPNNFGLLLVEAKESQVNSAIHMFFMKFDISVIWLDQNYQIVDTVIAKKGHALYAPSKPAKYTLETSVENFTFFQPGNQLQVIFDE